jgi:hypothetical protein
MSQTTYIRIISTKGDPHGHEVVFPVSSIWKIEVTYRLGNAQIMAADGVKNPDARRAYKLYVGADDYTLVQNPDSAVLKVIEEIYKSAVKD